MKTYISDLIPKLQRFSQKLDNLTLLTNQHWVMIDDIDNVKSVYIFRDNNQLLISLNGKVEKANWEYLGHNTILIDRKDESYLFKQGFFDENILALKIDSRNEYAFLVNETKYDQELNSLDSIADFLNTKYLSSDIKRKLNLPDKIGESKPGKKKVFNIKQGELSIIPISYSDSYEIFLNGRVAPDGKYKLESLHYIVVKNGLGKFSSSPF